MIIQASFPGCFDATNVLNTFNVYAYEMLIDEIKYLEKYQMSISLM